MNNLNEENTNTEQETGESEVRVEAEYEANKVINFDPEERGTDDCPPGQTRNPITGKCEEMISNKQQYQP